MYVNEVHHHKITDFVIYTICTSLSNPTLLPPMVFTSLSLRFSGFGFADDYNITNSYDSQLLCDKCYL
jgi:hypothetical protein